MKKMRRAIGGYVFLAAILLFAISCSSDPRKVLEKAARCMQQGDYPGAEKNFRWLLRQNPDDTHLQANLAFALTAQDKRDKHDEAITIYGKLVSEGEGAYDLFANFAKSLNAVGREDEAITWNYRTLSVFPRLVDVRGDLAKLLVKNGRSYEALALLASFDNELEDRGANPYFKAQRIAISATLPPPSETSTAVLKAVKIAGHYYSIVLGDNDESLPFIIDTGATHTTMSRQALETLRFAIPRNAQYVTLQTAENREITGQQFTLPKLHVGPYILKNVKVVVCENCASLLGQTTLERFDLTTKNADGLEYLSMKLRS